MNKGIGHLQATLTSRLAPIKLLEVKNVVLDYAKEQPEYEQELLSHGRTIYVLKRNYQRRKE
jgi:hypothetical protein